MVMYRQNRGLEARGTIGPQSTGGMMSPQRPQYSLQSFAGTQPMPAPQQQAPKAPPMPSAPMMAPKTAQRKLTQQEMNELSSVFQKATGRAFATSAEAAGWTAPDEQYVNLYNQYVSRAPTRPAPRVGATFSLPTNMDSQTVDETFRPPARSAAADIQNPFTPEMQALMESKAIEQAEQQAAVTAQRLNAQLAGTGLMSGGPSGLSASMARQVASSTEANRLNALREIGLQVPQMRADFDLRRAGVVDPYNISASAEGRAFARQPLELGGMERQNVLLDKQGRQLDIQNSLNELELGIKGNPEVIKSTVQALIDGNHLKGAELEAAKILLEENDPKAWWNNQAYKAGKEGILTVLKGFAEGAGRGLASK